MNLRAGSMRYSIFCVLLLMISELLLIHAKVLLVVPVQKTRRSPAPWRPNYKSSYGNNDFRHTYYDNRYYNKKPIRPYPLGSDFDQGYEAENHVYVPYGKDISHNLSFGKPYIPYNIKGNNLPSAHERYAGAYSHQPPSTGIASVGQEYAASTSAHSYKNPHVDSFFSDMDARGDKLHDSLKNSANKYYTTRSIEKDFNLKNQQAISSVVEKDSMTKGTEMLVKDIPTNAYTTSNAGTEGAVILPANIPSATIAGNKDGIVLRDTVSLDEYQKKLEELTKIWPSVLSEAMPNFAATAGLPAVHHQQLQTGFPITGLPGFASFGGPTNWFSSFAQPKQGYAVHENQYGDPMTYDFRTMPIHAAYQQLSFGGANMGLPIGAGIAPSIHG